MVKFSRRVRNTIVMADKTLLNIDELLSWLNAEGGLLKPITYPRLQFWLQSRRVPADRKQAGRNLYAIETAQKLAELIKAHQLLRSTIKWRPQRGNGNRRAKTPVGV